MNTDDPKLIFQNVLDAMSQAVAQDGVKGLMPLFSLPYLHLALDAKIMLETREDLIAGLEAFYQTLASKGVDKVIRLASKATHLSANYIDGIYVSHLLRGTLPIVRSYTNRAVIRRTTDGWKLTETMNGFRHNTWPIRVFSVPDEVPDYTSLGIEDSRRSALEPLAIYQTFINAMTRANVSGNFEDYCNRCLFPHTSHTNNHDTKNVTKEHSRVFFDALLELLEEHKVEDFMRIADHAEFVSADEICGYHTARFLPDGPGGLAPVKSRMILKRLGTRWFMSSVTNSLSNEGYPYRHPIPTEDLMTQLAIQKRTNTWPTSQ
ncbi:MAG: hypothetical protein ABJL99_23530 [Aliishimia sp.]